MRGRALAGMLVLLGPAVAARAAPPSPRQPVVLGVAIPVEDPTGRALAPMHAALRRAERKVGQARLLFFGASHVAADIFTGEVRRLLQTRFGDAGHGFVLPAKPWRSYRHADVNIESSRGWEPYRVRWDRRERACYGPAGVSVAASSPEEYGAVRTTTDNLHGRQVGRFDLFYWLQPAGGTLQVTLDDLPPRLLPTRGEPARPRLTTFEVVDGPHRLEVRPVGDGEVRLFGVAMERDVPGVIVDSLGINGARASYQLAWDEGCLREHLWRRRPDLVVLAYGTNEAGDTRPIPEVEARLRAVVGRVRSAVPAAACLLIGPSDRPVRLEDGSYARRLRTAEVVGAQRRVALTLGCGFFDLVAFMGGEMSMVRWAAHAPPYGAPDHVHLTRRGYERLGAVLTRALLAGYDVSSR